MKQTIDITGPDGNAFVILGIARKLSGQLDKDADSIADEMMAGDYEHLLEVFEREFGEYVDIQR